MTDASADIGVQQARGWANKLIAAHHRGPGDTVEAAIHRAAVKHGLDPKSLWRLRYRTPKDMLLSTWARIKEAYEAECERQEALVAHNLEMLKALPPSNTRDRLAAELARFQADRSGTPEAEAPRRGSTD